MHWYLTPFKQYAAFSGRASRKAYWMFFLISSLISFALRSIDVMFRLYDKGSGVGLLSGVYSLVVVLPFIALTVRRLHDVNRSGWWLLAPIACYTVAMAAVLNMTLVLVEQVTAMMSGMIAAAFAVGFMITGIVVLVFLCLAGSPGMNRFGLNPNESPMASSGLSLDKHTS